MRVAENRGSLLIVDDTAETLTLLARFLETRGYRVSTVDSGTQAIQAALAAAPDLILLDISMPEMDGFETFARMKDEEHTREIPVIFFSARGSREEKAKAFKVGGVDYVLKPLEVEEVEARVNMHLAILRM